MSALAAVTLDDKYALETGRVYLTGTQALVRLPMMQRQRDLAAGLNTAGYISGYRGSPLGGFDQALWQAKKFLEQQPHRLPARRQRGPGGHRRVGHPADRPVPATTSYDGVFAMWYGKGPGVDRSGDVLQARQLRRHLARTAACWRWPATTIPASPRPPRTRASTPSWTPDPGAASRRACRSVSISACMAGRCRATPAAGSASR